MWNRNLMDILKLLASIGTPVAIALVGILINRAIQRQNAATQRQSSWLVKWADDFLKAASGFNDSATSFLMVYFLDHVKSINEIPGAIDEQKKLHLDVLPHFFDLNRWQWELTKYAGFTPDTGQGLEKAADALVDEASSWLKNKGGDVQAFRQKQLAFNENVRRVHAELLGLDNL